MNRAHRFHQWLKDNHSGLAASVTILVGVLTIALYQGISFGMTVVRNALDGDRLSIMLALNGVTLALVLGVMMYLMIRIPGLRDMVSNGVSQRFDTLSDQVNSLKRQVQSVNERYVSGGYEADDVPALWDTVSSTAMISVMPKWTQEIDIENGPQGQRFRATDWVRSVMLPRVVLGTALSDWRIIIYVPKVEKPFESQATLPIRKLLFLIEHLKELAAREGKKITFDHIRICVVRTGNKPESVFSLTRQTMDGPESLVLKYTRGALEPSYDGKVIVYPGSADQKNLRSKMEELFHDPNSIKLTVNELVSYANDGPLPDAPYGRENHAYPDHAVY